MLWEKRKYVIPIQNRHATLKTTPVHGLIQQLIVVPPDGVKWSLRIHDKEGDVIFESTHQIGRLDDKSGIPVGRDSYEELIFRFYDIDFARSWDRMFKAPSGNMEVILKIREIR